MPGINIMDQSIKLVISYNMKPGMEEACHRYIVQELGSMLNEYGFRFTDAWYTAWGNGPQMMGGGLLDSPDVARELLLSKAWRDVIAGLDAYVDDFSVKLIQPAKSFQF